MKPGTLTIERVFHSSAVGVKAAVIIAATALLGQVTLAFSFVVPRLGTLRFLRLHYTSEFGVDWIDDWRYLFLFPAVGMAVFFVNAAAAWYVSSKQPVVGPVIAYVTAFIEIILAVAGGLAVLINS